MTLHAAFGLTSLCPPTRHTAMSSPAALQEWQTSVQRDLQYVNQPAAADESSASTPSRFHQLDLYVASPSAGDAAAPAPRPLLVFIHGGLWVESVATTCSNECVQTR